MKRLAWHELVLSVCLVALIAAMAGCSSNGIVNDVDDGGAGTNDTGTCDPEVAQVCSAMEIHWKDSCGNVDPQVVEACDCPCAAGGATCGLAADPLKPFIPPADCTDRTTCVTQSASECTPWNDGTGTYGIRVGGLDNSCSDQLRCVYRKGDIGCGVSGCAPGPDTGTEISGAYATLEECQADLASATKVWACTLWSDAESCLPDISISTPHLCEAVKFKCD